jgi:DNA mismatch repair protein MutL
MPHIHVLKPSVARLIAAGEVIDRPQAVLRELLDNALDSGATRVEVEIEGGGVDRIRVVDDGCGMGREDLGLAILSHATSKIESADDLLTARTLGFRGEALASIAACSRLSITSRERGAAEGTRLVAEPGAAPRIETLAASEGTQVEARGLFENYPARKQFLKRAQAEGSLCKQVFVDKALAHPNAAFRFSSEGRLGLALLPSSLEGRLSELYHEAPAGLVYRVRFSGAGFEGNVVLASPSFSRPDRRLMQVFVNRRRIQDAGLLQALDYAFSGFLPGGLHPLAFLFVEIDPALADFNIHPAKKEVRFKDVESLRRAFVAAVQAFLLDLGRREPGKTAPASEALLELEGGFRLADAAYAGPSRFGNGGAWGRAGEGGSPGFSGGSARGSAGSWGDLGELRERVAPLPRYALGDAEARADGAAEPSGAGEPRFVGTALGLFLVVEWQDAVYLIDQHAAHERLLFDEFSAIAPAVQELLVPSVFEPESEAEAARVGALLPELKESGFEIEAEGGSFLITALPAALKEDPVGALKEILRDLPERPSADSGGADSGGAGRGGAEGGAEGGVSDGGALEGRSPGGERSMRGGVLRAMRATSACRAAVKDGDVLDREAARELALRALALSEPRCPHGRPIWVRITREELYRLVRRIV